MGIEAIIFTQILKSHPVLFGRLDNGSERKNEIRAVA